MIQKLQRTAAFSFCSLTLVTFMMAVTTSPAHAFGPGTFIVGLAKTMANMAMEPIQIFLLPIELMDHDSSPSVTTAPSKTAPSTTTTTTTTTTK